jgi:putative ABC transport system ATP-binding protein
VNLLRQLRAGSSQLQADNSNTPPSKAVDLQAVSRYYTAGRRSISALDEVSLSISIGEYVSIVGASGSGKSTLLNIISGIDAADTGAVTVLGRRLEAMNQDKIAAWRGRNVGIVFQFFQLMPTLTVRENVVLPMDLAGNNGNKWERADELLEMVGLTRLVYHLPSELSGGEQQRAAIARAIANRPGLLIADEPTGNLDSANSSLVIDIIERLWRSGTTVILVTHDRDIAQRAPRRIVMADGRITSDSASVATSGGEFRVGAHVDAR